MNKIIGKLSDIISEEEWDLLYYEVREEVLNDLFKKEIVDIILSGKDEVNKIKVLREKIKGYVN